MTDERPEAPLDEAERFQMLLVNGSRMLARGKHNTALPLLQEAYEMDPDHPDAALNLGGAYILAGKFSRAIPVLEKLSEQEPANAMLWINLGAAYLGNPVLALDRHQQKAIEAFRQALALDPEAPSAAYNIGLIYRDRGELDEAITWFREALRSNPDDGDAHMLLARSAAERAAEEE
jgi:tetratricopeptide (TPR) repeat protein